MNSLTVFPIQTCVHLSERMTMGPREVDKAMPLVESDCDCSSDCACSTEEGSLPHRKLRLIFRDREAVLRGILNHTSRITVLDAPAGYGKTYLLEEVKNQLERKDWQCVLISFPFDAQLLNVKRDIHQKIAQALGFS